MPTVPDAQLPRGAGTGARDVVPRLAASVILLRGEPYEVLLLRRNAASSFVPGAWVFPGGTVDAIDREIAGSIDDGSELTSLRVCAIRELFEEAGVWIGEALDDGERRRAELLADASSFRSIVEQGRPALSRLVPTSRWITPVGVPKRFDTWFFLATVAGGTRATPEHQESVEVTWATPEEALARHRRGEMPLVFPTIKSLEAIAGFESASELIASREGLVVEPVLPVLVVDDEGRMQVALPDES